MPQVCFLKISVSSQFHYLKSIKLSCPWECHFMTLFPAWLSWQAVLSFSHMFIKLKCQKKLQQDSNILASPEAGGGNCLSYVLAQRFPTGDEMSRGTKIISHRAAI